MVQQVFVCGDEAHKAAILDTLTRDDSLLKFSKHKYASNVVETVLMHGQPHHKERILQEILKVSHVIHLFEKSGVMMLIGFLFSRYVFLGHKR